MHFRQLEYLVVLAREKHFTRAADACAVSQPALSEAIRKLEIELDLPLIVRGHKFEGLTPEGLQIVRWAREILDAQQSLHQAAKSLRSGVTGVVRIGVIPTASAAAADIASPLAVRHPLVSVHFTGDLSASDIAARLDRFELDGGITYLDDPIQQNYRCFPIYREQYMLLTADDPTSPRRSEISWSEASRFAMCTLPSIMRGRRILDEHFAYEGVTQSARIETDSVATLYAHVKTGQWAAVVPQMWSRVFGEPPGLRYTPLTPNLPAPVVGLITRVDGPSSILVEALEVTASTLDRTSSVSPIDR
ncbi:LysR family transcriptional regulator [Rhodococcus sp. 06-156-3C]|uniref:LysR family transcriptional regulator n=1 Tax=Nocardiaceae TaxID=85025 RepID=UPI0005230C78|nr:MULTISPECIES: LysR family transcriptional regulator [Rhodococcus]OZD18183.1 LysR family transcriptional regulator [Rhodococcus sp. 06-156-4C]OZD18780.1 LysR family transcriptional regulator [Rhodococcus sp. 06-156-3C]OZD22290.1 LysR family transcriptional regulator [Rhodococcus sp. 06-156-4a]OZD34096.1 LysR family transcriptional regulator [Rhodococcus sp. 06-156-3b]OZD38833.1 LysR family transcriptional regulator [Rhodococcus sp. 06-156-3]